MQVEEMCACDIESSFTPLDSKILNKIFEVSLINDTMKFFFEDQEITVLHCYASLSQN
jgi:hypothetical protein